jgi:hypothetical protein
MTGHIRAEEANREEGTEGEEDKKTPLGRRKKEKKAR